MNRWSATGDWPAQAVATALQNESGPASASHVMTPSSDCHVRPDASSFAAARICRTVTSAHSAPVEPSESRMLSPYAPSSARLWATPRRNSAESVRPTPSTPARHHLSSSGNSSAGSTSFSTRTARSESPRTSSAVRRLPSNSHASTADTRWTADPILAMNGSSVAPSASRSSRASS